MAEEPLDRIPARQADQALRRDVAPAHYRRQVARRFLCAGEHQREARERQLDESRGFLQRRAQRDVHLARLHHLHEVRPFGVDQLDVELRMQSSECADRLRQGGGGGGRGGGGRGGGGGGRRPAGG